MLNRSTKEKKEKMLSEGNKIELYNGDCLIESDKIKSGSVDLIILDLPYNIGKNKDWDKITNYIDFVSKIIDVCDRILKDNGSLYFFHNDFMQIVEIQNMINRTPFVFKQFLVWNKKYKGCQKEGFLQGFNEVEGLRNYQKMAEYCLFYTKQDDFIDNRLYIHCVSEIQNYVKDLIYKYGGNVTRANEYYCKYSGKIGNYRSLFFGKSQPVLYTEQQYNGLVEYIRTLGCNEQIKKYEEILKMVDRTKFKDMRYTFNNQKINHSIMNYEIPPKIGHETPKPIEMLEDIIKYSSNENDLVVDLTMGSGSTGVACKNTNRRFTGIEMSEQYFNIAKKRIYGTET